MCNYTSSHCSVAASVITSALQGYMGVSEDRGASFWGPYNKDPTI